MVKLLLAMQARPSLLLLLLLLLVVLYMAVRLIPYVTVFITLTTRAAEITCCYICI
jgi:hypothetical protein